MHPSTFLESNVILKAPKDMPNCTDLEVWQGRNDGGDDVTISCWKPTEEEIEYLKNGGSVYLIVNGFIFFPTALICFNPFQSGVDNAESVLGNESSL